MAGSLPEQRSMEGTQFYRSLHRFLPEKLPGLVVPSATIPQAIMHPLLLDGLSQQAQGVAGSAGTTRLGGFPQGKATLPSSTSFPRPHLLGEEGHP